MSNSLSSPPRSQKISKQTSLTFVFSQTSASPMMDFMAARNLRRLSVPSSELSNEEIKSRALSWRTHQHAFELTVKQHGRKDDILQGLRVR